MRSMASRRMAQCAETCAVLRDAALRTAPQDEVQLLRLDLDLLQHLAPFVLLGAHEGRELLTRGADRPRTLRGEPLLHEVRFDEARDLGVEPVDDRLRRSRWGNDAEPQLGFVAGNALLGD